MIFLQLVEPLNRCIFKFQLYEHLEGQEFDSLHVFALSVDRIMPRDMEMITRHSAKAQRYEPVVS